jgi:hypothetical protein
MFVHLTSVPKCCYMASLGIGYHTHIASNIEKDEMCTEISSFVCYH